MVFPSNQSGNFPFNMQQVNLGNMMYGNQFPRAFPGRGFRGIHTRSSTSWRRQFTKSA
ncbi:hypothetical protein PD280_16495 [Virgibacillus salarius]|uniref:hypothetical protein n=1 Tax=Virgibacillus salarius TaxID=447199 RepID=UPI0024914900|nr:hypothetical protein [Virgibacillus salarius]WBX79317.1 hypothetical protein PD280_16495 [Virgibacillus salarius]